MAIDFDAAQITNLQLKRAALLAAQQLAAAHQIVRSNPRLMQGADPLVLATIATSTRMYRRHVPTRRSDVVRDASLQRPHNEYARVR